MKLSRFLAILLPIIWYASSAYGQAPELADPEKLKELCQQILCRDPRPVRLTLEDGNAFETQLKLPLPIVQNEWISILPGESLFVEGDVEGDRLINLRAVRENKVPEKTVQLRFWQEMTSGKPAMFLLLKQPFAKWLKYHAVMMLPNSEQMYKTSSCPISNVPAYEMWPHPIFQLILFDLRFVEQGKDTKCEF